MKPGDWVILKAPAGYYTGGIKIGNPGRILSKYAGGDAWTVKWIFEKVEMAVYTQFLEVKASEFDGLGELAKLMGEERELFFKEFPELRKEFIGA